MPVLFSNFAKVKVFDNQEPPMYIAVDEEKKIGLTEILFSTPILVNTRMIFSLFKPVFVNTK